MCYDAVFFFLQIIPESDFRWVSISISTYTAVCIYAARLLLHAETPQLYHNKAQQGASNSKPRRKVAMELVTRALGSLILKLGELLKDEYNLHKGLKDEVKSLSEELKSAQAALDMVANNVPPGYKLDTVVKLWSDEVREASYDMEDALDAFLVRVEGCKPADPHGAKWFNLKEKICKLLRKRKDHHEIADMIKSIKKRVDEVGERRRRYQVGDDIVAWPAASSIDPRLTSMYKEVRQLVGIDQPRDDIISLLSMHGGDASKGEVKVVSVFGVGGLGKTTLAKASYDTLKMGFDCSAFVPVGQKPDLKKVLRDILIDLNTKVINIAILDERQLIDELQDFLENKRYIIYAQSAQ